jgi:hypothetical protein
MKETFWLMTYGLQNIIAMPIALSLYTYLIRVKLNEIFSIAYNVKYLRWQGNSELSAGINA